MANYILCPRCELNFIDADEQEYCEVCVKELSGAKTFVDNFEDEDNTEETELCPICGENYMAFGEKMCESCKKKSQYEDEIEDDETDDPDKTDAWRTYLDDEEEEEIDLGIPDSEFEDDKNKVPNLGPVEDEDEEKEEEEDETSVEDDFEYVSADDYYDYDDDEDDEEDDDDDDGFDDDDAPTPKSGRGRKKRNDDDF